MLKCRDIRTEKEKNKKQTHRETTTFSVCLVLQTTGRPLQTQTRTHTTNRIEEETWSKRTHAADGPFRDHT